MAGAKDNFKSAFGKGAKGKTNFLVFGLVAIGVAGAAALVTRGKTDGSATATLQAAPTGQSKTAGVDTATDSYLQALRESNARETQEAAQKGGSAVATLTSKSVKIDEATGLPQKIDLGAEPKPVALQAPPPPNIAFAAPEGKVASMGGNFGAPDDTKRRSAVASQLGELLAGWQAPGQAIAITRPDTVASGGAAPLANSVAANTVGGYLNDGSSTAVNSVNSVAGAQAVTLIPSGTIFSAVLDTEVVSSDNGPILATIVAGPYKGAKMIGNSRLVDEKVALQFNSLSFKGATVAVNAFAVDQSSARVGLADEVETHWFRKYGLVFLSSFVGGYGEAAAQNASVTSNTSTGSTVVQQAPLSSKDRALVAAGKSGTTLAQQLSQEASKVQTTVTVHQGSPVGILFVGDVSASK